MKRLVWVLFAVGLPALIIVLVLGVVGVSVLIGLLRWRRAMRQLHAISEADDRPPEPPQLPAVERWAAGAYGVWTGGEDCARWDSERARQSLQSWYGASEAASLRETIEGLATGEATGNAAWDQVRAIDLVRIGIAAGYLTREQARDITRGVASALRARYGSWEEVALAFEEGMHDWQDSRGITDPTQRGRVQRNLPALRASIWPQIPYRAEL